MQYIVVTHTSHKVVKHNLSINLSNRNTAVSVKNPPQSVLDTGNPYHVACLHERSVYNNTRSYSVTPDCLSSLSLIY